MSLFKEHTAPLLAPILKSRVGKWAVQEANHRTSGGADAPSPFYLQKGWVGNCKSPDEPKRNVGNRRVSYEGGGGSAALRGAG